jgi:crossover junction endodeoxyribonuclease RusA
VSIAILVQPKTRNAPDADNCVASCKAYLDGIADAMRVDDRAFAAPWIAFSEPVKGGLITFTLAERR